ncbi:MULTISPECIES: SMI1/KNR4 family protein [Streptomyces]|uniref:SMI1/KNR4 family protein n=1 Tax=Streptomyces tsukubensis (strain DSM 42081 / NBRC 108919 / NRRL 18488 / 9993) TaxID=1114943 RepID=I2MTP1_STRT9|nr:SMI1/KNR4 family protein [Streptomyces tsukubensis]MYS67018.1 SMI1/KNR4 family protein [Streptomyces sp. SID5473]AZK92711.1 hypothetical protein B7R87_01465 [Streptomyces tsukubensis]EIF88138.1 hypothetical protein [Streptomyces tsukubensis NRRL18488]QKM71122.1 SMI1/KNR4 family protein [Streptomyces tsukubensis NRRL18488]TAI41626.1 SMI1/KNR4 family protein [Streptomyces tsukubensis]
MTDPSVARLTGLVPPPGNPPAAPDWDRVEAVLGTPLPDDYKQLIEVYGGGVFDETVWVLAPGCEDEDYDLLAQTEERGRILADLWASGEPRPAEIGDSGTRLIPWATVEEAGHYLYWLVRPGQEPSEWTVVLNEGRGPEWESHPQSCGAFLAGLLTGDVRSFYFDEFPLPAHSFDANSDIL